MKVKSKEFGVAQWGIESYLIWGCHMHSDFFLSIFVYWLYWFSWL